MSFLSSIVRTHSRIASLAFSIIAAMDKNRGIGKDNHLPWSLNGDMEHFRALTVGKGDPAKPNVVIMGRNTWDSLPEKARPLRERLNVVLSRLPDLVLPPDVAREHGLDEALQHVSRQAVGEIFIIGGASVYAQAIQHPACTTLHLTEIDSEFACDSFFPDIPTYFKRMATSAWQHEGKLRYRFVTYHRNA